MEVRSITIRCSTDVAARHERAARAAGRTLAAHVAALLEHTDPDAIEDAEHIEDEVAVMRRRQLAALENLGLLDDATRTKLSPHALPRVLDAALAQARKGGPGMRFFGSVLGQHLGHLLPDAAEEIDAIAAMPGSAHASRAMACARLGDLLREHLPAVFDALDRRHEGVVLDAAVAELASASRSAAS